MLDPAQWLVSGIGLVTSAVTFALMFFPGSRRPQFRSAKGFSLIASLAGALLVLLVFLVMAHAQGRSQ